MTTPIFGSRVSSTFLYRRETTRFPDGTVRRTWSIHPTPKPITGIYIGTRTIRNLHTTPSKTHVVEYSFQAALIVPDEYTAPVRVPLDSITNDPS